MDSTLAAYRDGAGAVDWPTLRQDGQTVFRWAVWEMAKVAKQALEAAGITADDLAAFIPHQANMRIIDELAKQLKLPEHVLIARDIETTGNTSAASIPLATHALLAGAPRASRRPRPADRLRRRSRLRRAGGPAPLRMPGARPIHCQPSNPTPSKENNTWHCPPKKSSPASPS